MLIKWNGIETYSRGCRILRFGFITKEISRSCYLLEWRSVPVLVPAQLPQARYKKQDERVLVNMLEGFDLPDGYKRTDVEKLLNISRSPAGNVLKKLKESELVTNFSPFTERESTSSYWLTTKGRELVEELLAREASRNRLQQGEDS